MKEQLGKTVKEYENEEVRISKGTELEVVEVDDTQAEMRGNIIVKIGDIVIVENPDDIFIEFKTEDGLVGYLDDDAQLKEVSDD